MSKNTQPNIPESGEVISQTLKTKWLAKTVRNTLARVGLSVLAATTALPEKVVADEVDGVEVATLNNSASTDAQGESIDNDLNSLSIDDINQRIAEIDEEILAIENLSDITTDDRRLKRELQKEKDALQERLIALENQQQAENQATIEAENQQQAENEATIETRSDTVENLEQINDTIGNN